MWASAHTGDIAVPPLKSRPRVQEPTAVAMTLTTFAFCAHKAGLQTPGRGIRPPGHTRLPALPAVATSAFPVQPEHLQLSCTSTESRAPAVRDSGKCSVPGHGGSQMANIVWACYEIGVWFSGRRIQPKRGKGKDTDAPWKEPLARGRHGCDCITDLGSWPP